MSEGEKAMKLDRIACSIFLLLSIMILNLACDDSTSSRKKVSVIPVWWAEYGIGNEDGGHAVVADNNGNYVATGYSERGGDTGSDLLLVAVDSLGSLIYQKPHGGTSGDIGEGICLANQDAYMICGRTSSFDSYDLDGYLIGADDSGNSVWFKNYIEPGHDFLYDIVSCDDGGYAAAGQSGTPENPQQAWIVKFAADGTMEWQKHVGGAGREDCRGIIRTDDGYMIAGVTESFGNGMQIYLAKFDDTGKFLWEKNYGGPDLDIALDLTNAPEGGCWIAGYTRSKGAGSDDGYLLRITSDGDLYDDYTFGGYSREVFYGVTATPDGGCVAVGENYSATGSQDCYAVRVDNRGRAMFDKTYHVNQRQLAFDVVPALDGGFALTGETFDSYAEGRKLFILKIGSMGESDLTAKITE